MRRIRIYSAKYAAELADFAHDISDICTVNNCMYIWESPVTERFARSLMHLLHRIAMNENPVYRHSPKLRDLADGLLDTDTHAWALVELTAFLKTGRAIILEGYVTFRMEAYHAKLDMMLYTIVKKINLSKH